MKPVTDGELNQAYTPPRPAESLIGFADPVGNDTTDSPFPQQPPAESAPSVSQATKAPAGPVGMIDVTTVPYLAEIYIDGASAGYSPAKFTLPAGKHVLRAQKNGYQIWSSEISVPAGSEFTVHAELKKK